MIAQPRIASDIAGSRLHRVRGPGALALALAAAFKINPGGAQPATPVSGPLPDITPQARASELIQPATVFVQVNWDAQVTVPPIAGYEGGVVNKRWRTGCTGFLVNPAGYIVTAGHCLDDGREGAQRVATVMVVDELVENGHVPNSERDALIDALGVGNARWKIEGTPADSRPDRQVHVSVGGGKAPWNGASSSRSAGSVHPR
jgi:serine protease Do